ncbi:phosphatase domain-containing protein [Dermacoccaceae bacterium W4C1]
MWIHDLAARLRPRPSAATERVLDDPAGCSVADAAEAIWALQRGWTTRTDEAAIARILCARNGADLLELKSTLSARPDYHDLEQLLFRDVGDEALRFQVLRHIAEQARDCPVADVKVFCDIDDTVFAKLHDDRYPRGSCYPGVLAFLEALDRGPLDAPATTGDLTFVSARPRVAFGLIENSSRDSLRKAGVRTASMLSGGWWSLRSHRGMADGKVTNVEHYRQLYPEYGVVFIGDSGQGDIEAARTILERFPEAVRGAFIHDVTGIDADERESLAGSGIQVYDSYAGAAGQALRLGLISDAGAGSVGAEVDAEFEELEWSDDQARTRAREVLNRDIAALSGI